MRIVVCDYSGHPFQVQLSRELLRRGHSVLHLYFAEFQTPKGRLEVGPEDPPQLQIEAVSLGKPFAKYSYFRRRFQEVEIGRRIANRIERYSPDIVVGCNLPLDSLNQVVRRCRTLGRPFVFWQQDIYSIAIGRILTAKFGPVGRALGAYYRYLEARALAASAAIVVIADDFVTSLTRDFGITRDRISVVENWAPLEEISPRPKSNDWARSLSLGDTQVVLYTGTIGMKHDPSQILELAKALKSRPRTAIVVTSVGPAADWLAEQAKKNGLQNLRVLPFLPFAVYPDALGAADVLIAILEADAGIFSVPSKVLSYHCAGRAIVLSAPLENLASMTVRKSGAGITVPPGNHAAFIDAVTTLLDDDAGRERAAANARRYAEQNFEIRGIGDRFEAVLLKALKAGQKQTIGESLKMIRLNGR